MSDYCHSFTHGLAAFLQFVWAMGAYSPGGGLLLGLLGFALSWYAQFRLDNDSVFQHEHSKLWWADRLKGLLFGRCA